MGFELILIFVMLTFDAGVFDSPVYSFDLPVDLGEIGFGCLVFNIVCIPNTIKDVVHSVFRAGLIRKKDAIIRQNCVDMIGEALMKFLKKTLP